MSTTMTDGMDRAIREMQRTGEKVEDKVDELDQSLGYDLREMQRSIDALYEELSAFKTTVAAALLKIVTELHAKSKEE